MLASDLAHNVRACRGQALDHVQRVVSPLVAGGWLTPEKDWNPFSWKVAPGVHAQFEHGRDAKPHDAPPSVMYSPEGQEQRDSSGPPRMSQSTGRPSGVEASINHRISKLRDIRDCRREQRCFLPSPPPFLYFFPYARNPVCHDAPRVTFNRGGEPYGEPTTVPCMAVNSAPTTRRGTRS